MVISLSKDSLDDMVLPGMKKSWEYQKRKWFVMDESQIRTPGTKKLFLFHIWELYS